MNLLILNAVKLFVSKEETYSPVPVWDNKQWSWGYGTAAGFDPANKPKGTITEPQAMAALIKVAEDNYNYLKPKITRQLTPNQWAALLSFSYNLGPGRADDLVPLINSGNDNALFAKWDDYVHSAGKVAGGLVKRRAKEIELWKTKSILDNVTKKSALLLGGGLLLIAGGIILYLKSRQD